MKQFLQIIYIPLLGFLWSLSAWAQTTVSGKVTDAKNGEPLAGATVLLKGTNQVAVSDIDGNYLFRNADAAGVFVFSYVGYQTQEIAIAGKTNLDVALLASWILGDELVVIGSRNQSRTKIETAVPVDIIPISQVSNGVGQVDINQILTYIAPSFQSARQAIADGTDHVDPAQLRGLGPDQVLVLVNGKRRHQSALVNVNGTVNRGTVGTDMSAIPVSAIDRIEILRDGAAAQYGSDAIAGVINIVLKKATGKLDATVSYGLHVSEYDKNFAYNAINSINEDPKVSVTDGNTAQVGANFGFKLGERGYINLTGEYITRDYTNRSGLYTGQIYPNENNVVKDDSIMLARGLDRNAFDMRIGSSAIDGGSAMLNSAYNLNNRWTLYAFGSFNKKNGNASGFYRYPNTINTNAKIHALEVLALYPNGFLPEISSDITDLSLALGLRGQVGNWNLDISNTIGQNTFDFTVNNSVNYTQAAVTADLQTSFDAGGTNFLQNTTNLDLNREFESIMQGLNVAAGAELRLDKFGVRAGEEASYTNYDTASGATGGAQVFNGFMPENEGDNSRTAMGIYTDLELDLTKKLMISGALRFENYSDFGSTFNYKAAARYSLAKAFALRASVSTGFRAPSMQQRFYAKTSTIFVSQGGQLVPVQSGTFTNDSDPAQILGIPSLTEETSQHYALGISTFPIRGLELTVDAYQIDIKNRIVLTNNFSAGGDSIIAAQLSAANANQANFFANAVDTRSRGIEAVLSYGRKLGKHDLRFTLAGSFIDNAVIKDADGNAIVKASDILEQTGQIKQYFNREDQSRIEVASPQQKISAILDYKIGKLGVMLRAVHFGEVTYLDPTINPADTTTFIANAFDPPGPKQTLDQTFGAKAVFDLSLSYQVLKGVRLTVGSNNLFDVYQDLHTHSSNMSSGRFVYSRRVQQFGFNGRYVFARLKFDL